MFSRHIKLFFVLFLITITGAWDAYAQQDFSTVQIRTEKAGGNVFMLTGAGGNIAVYAGVDGVLMVDTQFAPLADKIRAAIGTISNKPVRYVVNTHWHPDHVGGNEYFASKGATVIAHENANRRMGFEQNIAFLKVKVPPVPKAALPVITFKRNITLHLNGEDVYIFHVGKAHTDGDAIVYFRHSNVIHMGDLFFNGRYPFIDLSTGGSVNGLIRAVRKALLLCDRNTKVIPGHGPITDRAGLDQYLDMLVAIRDSIAHDIKAGKTLDAVIAAKPTHAFDRSYVEGSLMKKAQFVGIIYESLKKDGR